MIQKIKKIFRGELDTAREAHEAAQAKLGAAQDRLAAIQADVRRHETTRVKYPVGVARRSDGSYVNGTPREAREAQAALDRLIPEMQEARITVDRLTLAAAAAEKELRAAEFRARVETLDADLAAARVEVEKCTAAAGTIDAHVAKIKVRQAELATEQDSLRDREAELLAAHGCAVQAAVTAGADIPIPPNTSDIARRREETSAEQVGLHRAITLFERDRAGVDEQARAAETHLAELEHFAAYAKYEHFIDEINRTVGHLAGEMRKLAATQERALRRLDDLGAPRPKGRIPTIDGNQAVVELHDGQYRMRVPPAVGA